MHLLSSSAVGASPVFQKPSCNPLPAEPLIRNPTKRGVWLIPKRGGRVPGVGCAQEATFEGGGLWLGGELLVTYLEDHPRTRIRG